MTYLTNLRPRWVGLRGEDWSMEGVCVIGLTFLCPHCSRRIGVLFKPFIDPNDIASRVMWALPDAPNPNTGEVAQATWWERVGGDQFSTLSLRPSIDVKGHWHGFLTDGEVR
jgi:hypothetical protein